jgi:hypothetical protein
MTFCFVQYSTIHVVLGTCSLCRLSTSLTKHKSCSHACHYLLPQRVLVTKVRKFSPRIATREATTQRSSPPFSIFLLPFACITRFHWSKLLTALLHWRWKRLRSTPRYACIYIDIYLLTLVYVFSFPVSSCTTENSCSMWRHRCE